MKLLALHIPILYPQDDASMKKDDVLSDHPLNIILSILRSGMPHLRRARRST